MRCERCEVLTERIEKLRKALAEVVRINKEQQSLLELMCEERNVLRARLESRQ